MADTLTYMQDVLDKLCEHLINNNEDGLASKQDSFIYQFGAFHEDMHTEAFIWGRQTLGYPTPKFSIASDVSSQRNLGSWPGFVEVPGRLLAWGFMNWIGRRWSLCGFSVIGGIALMLSVPPGKLDLNAFVRCI